jgi:membrane protein
MLAAGVAFFSLLALVPLLVAMVSIYGLVADPSDIEANIDDALAAAPREVRDLVSSQLDSIVDTSHSGLRFGAVGGLLLALWSASSGVKHLIDAVNRAYDRDETRGIVRLRGVAVVMTVGGILLLVDDRGRWQLLTPGAVAATVVWVVASLGFSVYTANFGRYNEVYGSLGAVMVVMLWLFITAYAVIAGAELNAELERQDTIDAIEAEGFSTEPTP